MKRVMCILLLHLCYTECFIAGNHERTDNFTALWHIRVSISCSKSTREKKTERQGERNRDQAVCFDSPEPEYCSIVCFSEQRSHRCGLSDSESDVRWHVELLHISSNCSALPELGTHVEHGKRRLFLGRNRGCCDLAYKEKRRQGGGWRGWKKSRRRSRRAWRGGILLFLIDYSEGQRGDGLACTTLWHNNVLH